MSVPHLVLAAGRCLVNGPNGATSVMYCNIDALALPLLSLVLNDCLPEWRLPVELVELAYSLIQLLIVNCVQVLDDLIAGIS